MHDLKENGTFCTGTVIKTRRGMPQSYRNARLEKGAMTVKSQGQLMAILWSDRRMVTVLTSTGSARYLMLKFKLFIYQVTKYWHNYFKGCFNVLYV